MATAPSWLDRLNTATDYRELQEVFNEIIKQAQAGGANDDFASKIDEAIRRLAAERDRDEKQLAENQAAYDSFKQDQSGVIGWFKRHTPFTQARRDELTHRGSIADQ